MTAQGDQFVTDTQLWNAIMRLCGTPIPLGGWSATLQEAEPPFDPPVDPPAVLSLVACGEPLTLLLEQFPLAGLSSSDLSLSDIHALPVALRDGLLSGMAVWVLERLPAKLADCVSPPAVASQPIPQDVWISITLTGPEGQITLRLGGTRQGFCRFVQALFPDAPNGLPGQPAMVLATIPTRLQLTIGEQWLPAQTLQELEVGDVLLPALSTDHWALEHPMGQFRATVVATGEAGAHLEIGDFIMANDSPSPEAVDTMLDIAEVPVRLSFSLGARDMTLAEVQGLVPGATLPLPSAEIATGERVHILANGAVIGIGDLVQIDDQLCVRIAKLKNSEASVP